MSRRRDRRVVVLLATLALVAALGALIQRGSSGTPPDVLTSPAPARAPGTRARFEEAVRLLRARHFERAAAGFAHLLEVAPGLPEAHVNLGFARLGGGDHPAARASFLRAIDLRPGQANAYWGLALSLEALCDLPAARGAMRSFVHLAARDDPFLPRARAALWEWQAGDAQGCRREGSGR